VEYRRAWHGCSTFEAPDITDMYSLDNLYLLYVCRLVRWSGQASRPRFWSHLSKSIWRPYPCRVCWQKTQTTQAQQPGIWSSNMTEMRNIYISYLQLVRFKEKESSGCAATHFCPPPSRQIPVHPMGFHPAKTGLPGRKSNRFEPVFDGWGHTSSRILVKQKKAGFFGFFFGGFTHNLYSKNSPIKLLHNYICVYI